MDYRKLANIVVAVFVLIRSTGAADEVRNYGETLTQTEVEAALTAEGVGEHFYLTPRDYLNAQPVVIKPYDPVQLRTQAISNLNTDNQATSKLQRAVFLVTLDEINLIRSLLVPAQSPRTVTQFKNAVQNKLTSGAAD